MRRPWLALACALVACGPDRSRVTSHGALGGDVVATVGALPIPARLVADVAAAQHVGPSDALDRLVDDAVAAQGATAAGLDRAPAVAWSIERVVARAAIDRMVQGAHATPPTDAEIDEATRTQWRDYALPEQIKVVHALVQRPKDPAQNDAARALAAQIASAVAGAKDAADFEARAKAVPTNGLDVIVQALPAFVADGRIAEGPEGTNDATFTKAAFALAKPGDTSGVVETKYGWHVIRLVERRPPHVVPRDERAAALADSIYRQREQDAMNATLDAAKARAAVDVRPEASALMATIDVTPR